MMKKNLETNLLLNMCSKEKRSTSTVKEGDKIVVGIPNIKITVGNAQCYFKRAGRLPSYILKPYLWSEEIVENSDYKHLARMGLGIDLIKVVQSNFQYELEFAVLPFYNNDKYIYLNLPLHQSVWYRVVQKRNFMFPVCTYLC